MFAVVLLASLPVIECPKWLPGTNEVLPAGVELSRELELNNKLRCYCEIVMPQELECKRNRRAAECKQRTQDWIDQNFFNVQVGQNDIISPPVRRTRMMTIEP